MTVNLKTCFIFSISIVFILPDFAMPNENKIEQQEKTSNKITLEKMRKKKGFPRIDERYSMMIIGPDCHSDTIDPGIIAKNTFDPSVHHELRVIDPYTKREITWDKIPLFGFTQPGIKPKEKNFRKPYLWEVKETPWVAELAINWGGAGSRPAHKLFSYRCLER